MIVDGMKFCTGHNDWTSIEDFNKRRASKDGLAHVCKECERAYHRQHYKKKSTKLVHRRSKLKLNYGLTVEEFNRMYEEQGGACGLCYETGRKLVVDHNHLTGKKRKLLCSSCNTGLGMFKDNPELLERAARYLRIYGNATVVE